MIIVVNEFDSDSSRNQYKVVLIDDEDVIVEGLQKVIDWDKYYCKVVMTACDAKTGVQMIQKYKPDILFLDIHMPDMDGLSMLSCLRADYPDMQVSILTGYRDIEYAKRAIKIGVTRYMLKPSKMDELEEALNAMISNLNKTLGNNQSAETDKSSEASNSFIVRNALKYIEIHYTEKLSLAEVAENIYVSQWYLSKLLNKYVKQSFSDILNKKRIQIAKRLLQNPSLRICEISDLTGFNDVSHFSKTFKKLENITPNEFRNQLRS